MEDCPLCRISAESAEHLFRDCTISDHLWKARGLGIVVPSNTHMNLGVWIKNFLSLFFHKDKRDDTRAVEFISTLWALWLHKNEVVFGHQACSPIRVIMLIQE